MSTVPRPQLLVFDVNETLADLAPPGSVARLRDHCDVGVEPPTATR